MTATGIVETTGTQLAYAAGNVIDAYLADLDASPKTHDTYARALRQYVAWLDDRGLRLEDTRRSDVISYKTELESTHSAATVNAYLTAVRGLYRWLNETTGYPNVAAGVKGVRKSAAIGHDALTADQARRLMDVAGEGDGILAMRDHAMVSLMVHRGLRCVEVSRANVGDLRQVGGEPVLFVTGKGHHAADDFIVLGDALNAEIRAYLAARGHLAQDAPLFASVGNRNAGGRMTTRAISRIVKDALRREGLDDPHLTAHSLRHTAVTLAIAGGASVQDAQQMARHASISTTMIYYHAQSRLQARAEHSIDAALMGA